MASWTTCEIADHVEPTLSLDVRLTQNLSTTRLLTTQGWSVLRHRIQETVMASTDHFRQGLLAQMDRMSRSGWIHVLINSGELYRSLGGYPGSLHGIPMANSSRSSTRSGDIARTKAHGGRTVILKVKFADFVLISRSRTLPGPVESRSELESVTLDLLGAVFPLEKAVRLLGVSISGFVDDDEPDHPRQIALGL
jgi:impB/mucB/samB family C-terminal domain